MNFNVVTLDYSNVSTFMCAALGTVSNVSAFVLMQHGAVRVPL